MSATHAGGATPPGRPPPPGGVREAALVVLDRVERENARAEPLLATWLGRFPDSHRDRALLTTLVNGTLRQRGYLDWLLGHFVKRDLDALDPRLRNNLRLALFQLEFLERVPARAIIFEAVELARRFGHEGTARFANGVLREAERRRRDIPRPDPRTDPVEAISILHSHPRWMVKRWVDAWGAEEAEAVARAGNRIPPVTLRVNRLATDIAGLASELELDGLHPARGRFSPDVLVLHENVLLPALRAFRRGWFTVQDEASALVPPALGAAAGETALDLCAGPGGKAAHLAELVGAGGRVLAVDRNRKAIRRVAENVARLHLAHVFPVEADGRSFELARPVDRVLVDAPCSGTGVLARRADARWRREEGEIARFHQLQCELLARGADLVRPGGTVLYSTCTLEPEENEGVVDEVLAARPELELERIAAPAPAAPAPAAASDSPAAAALPPIVDARGFLRLLPQHHGTDGAFAARFRRR